jgi:hypothetical protein
MAASDVNARVAAAVAHMDAGDYEAARVDLLAAKAYMAALPNAAGSGFSMQYDRESIDSLLAECRRLAARPAAGSRGIRSTKIRYARPDAEDDYD